MTSTVTAPVPRGVRFDTAIKFAPSKQPIDKNEFTTPSLDKLKPNEIDQGRVRPQPIKRPGGQKDLYTPYAVFDTNYGFTRKPSKAKTSVSASIPAKLQPPKLTRQNAYVASAPPQPSHQEGRLSTVKYKWEETWGFRTSGVGDLEPDWQPKLGSTNTQGGVFKGGFEEIDNLKAVRDMLSKKHSSLTPLTARTGFDNPSINPNTTGV